MKMKNTEPLTKASPSRHKNASVEQEATPEEKFQQKNFQTIPFQLSEEYTHDFFEGFVGSNFQSID